jgi:uncharacterized protein
MTSRSAFGSLVSASLLLVMSSKPSYCRQPNSEHAVTITVSELAVHPQKYDGKLVCVNAVAVNGWEGDNFLIDPSKPFPLEIPSGRDPASIWFYSKQLYSMLTNQSPRVDGAIEERTSDCHDFQGYFHFVARPRMMGVFYPGSLQLECIGDCAADSHPHSLAATTHSGDIDETRRILRADSRLRDRYKNLLLFLAAQTGRDDFAQELLAAAADPTFTTPSRGTSLMVAAWGCKMEVAKTLLSGGAPVNAANTKGETALMYASRNCHDGKMVKMLLEAGANPNGKGEKNFTALMWASGNPLNAEELLRAGADPTAKNQYGNTAEGDNCDRGDTGHSQVCSLIRDALKRSVGRSQDH